VAAQPALAAWSTDRSLWTAAVEKAPESARAWTGLSRALRLDGDHGGAEKACRRAIALDPNYAPARVTAAYNALARGDVDAARLAIDDARAVGGDEAPGLGLAVTCAAGPRERAAECIRN
jgi:Flp pilus assembly protein TadD